MSSPTAPMAGLIDALERAGERRRAAAADGGSEWAAAEDFAATCGVLRLDHTVDPNDDPDGPAAPEPLAGVAAIFGLDAVAAELLWLAAAPDLDVSVARAYAHLRGAAERPGFARPTVALALELVGVPTATAEAFERLGPDGPLRRAGLIELSDGEPWLARQLSVPDPVGAVLAGGVADDPVVARARVEAIPLELPGSLELARAMSAGTPLCWVRAAHGSAGSALGAGAFAALGLRWLAVDLRRARPNGLSALVAAATREAGLRGWGLLVIGAEVLAGRPDQPESLELVAFEALERCAVPVVAVATVPWNPRWLSRFPPVVTAETLSVEDRARLWSAGLGELFERDEQLRATLLGLRLAPEDIVEAARYAHVLATAADAALDGELVREAARRVGGSGRGGAERVSRPSVRGRRSLDDLVLPDHALGSLHRLVDWARHRDEVAQRTAEVGRGGRGGGLGGRGIAALFTGNPGTGKTLAAHAVADELSIDVFQVDLSAVVDKYIGETEKNLERVFQAAEALDVVLFFDEADALFGSRSEVRDARDRYANQEVAYLLQRMEHYSGITILATNLRGNLDRAFSRRMSFIIHFPDPDGPTRRRLWAHHLDQLPELDPADPPQLGFLAASAEIAGGDIRNIVLAAAYDAISEGAPVGMRHLTEAAVHEYRKLGRVVPEHGFVGTDPTD